MRGGADLRELRRAVAVLEEDARAGNVSSAYALATIFRERETPLFSVVKARRLLEWCWRSGLPEAAFDLATDDLASWVAPGWPAAPLSKRRLKWLSRAASLGHCEAMYTLAVAYINSGRRIAIRKARELLRRAAALGDRRAETLELLFELGSASSSHRARALARMRRIATEGCAPAMNAMGWHAVRCQVRPDYGRAVRWWRRAATGTCASAMWNLAVCCDRGIVLRQSRAKAARWVRKADRCRALWLCEQKGTPWWIPSDRFGQAERLARPVFDLTHGFSCSDIPGMAQAVLSIEKHALNRKH